MEANNYAKIYSAISERISECEKMLGDIQTTIDLADLKISEAQQLKVFCQSEEQIMTKIAMVDLYHIIGMGELTPPQMMQFIYKVKEYLQYRPLVKAIANNFDSISELPKIPVKTKYRLMGLCDLTLTADFDGCEDDVCEDVASVDDYEAAKINHSYSKECPFIISGKNITVDKTRIIQFVTILKSLFKMTVDKDTMLNRMKNTASYFGIQWMDNTGNYATGIVLHENTLARLENYFKKNS